MSDVGTQIAPDGRNERQLSPFDHRVWKALENLSQRGDSPITVFELYLTVPEARKFVQLVREALERED